MGMKLLPLISLAILFVTCAQGGGEIPGQAGNDAGWAGNDAGWAGNDARRSGNDARRAGNDAGRSGYDARRAGNDAGRADEVLPMTVERLPDLNVPRNAHTAAFVNGELTVIGGHTTGFIPTNTAEYYSNGAWHLIDSYFPHDYGFGVVLSPEEILVGRPDPGRRTV